MDIISLENEAEAYRIKLNSLTGRSINDKEITVFHNWEADTSAIDLTRYREALLENNPALRKMDNMINMNRLEITANEKELIPDLMIQGMLMRMPQGMILTEGSPVHMLDGTAETEYMYSLMASITLPFVPWASGSINNKSQEIEAGIKGIEYEKLNMYRQMRADLESTGKKLESSVNKIKLLKNEVIPLYKEALDSRISEYQNNLSQLSSVIDNIRMYLMKEEELGEAMADREMLLAEVREMTGELE
jgi:outer membrane protein TolC